MSKRHEKTHKKTQPEAGFFQIISLNGYDYAVIALTRLERREIFRAPVFLWKMPLPTARIIAGSAAPKAVFAAAWSPAVIASSTLRNVERTPVRRFLLVAVLRAILRTHFLADEVFAIIVSLLS